MNEQRAAKKWIRSTLGAASSVTDLVGTRIYSGVAPQKATYPLIIFSLLGGGENVHAAGQDRRIKVRLRFRVTAAVEGASEAPADDIADAFDPILVVQLSSVMVGDQEYAVLGCWQEQPLSYPEVDDGKDFRHAGGIYTLDVHGVP